MLATYCPLVVLFISSSLAPANKQAPSLTYLWFCPPHCFFTLNCVSQSRIGDVAAAVVELAAPGEDAEADVLLLLLLQRHPNPLPGRGAGGRARVQEAAEPVHLPPGPDLHLGATSMGQQRADDAPRASAVRDALLHEPAGGSQDLRGLQGRQIDPPRAARPRG